MIMAPTAMSAAPSYRVPKRKIVAVEHPMIIKNIDNGLKTFGPATSFAEVLNPVDYDTAIPLYLKPSVTSGSPILSQNVATQNIVLKIVVPRRTGRKRRKGTREPFLSPDELGEMEDVQESLDQLSQVSSHSRLDNVETLRRALQDNVEKYRVEAVGTIDQTHRYRGLADFHYSTTHSPFMSMMRDTVLSNSYTKLKDFHLSDQRGTVPETEIVPPPTFTDSQLPHNWFYRQNAAVTYHKDPTTGESYLKNSSSSKKLSAAYEPADVAVVPQGPLKRLRADAKPEVVNIVKELTAAFEERPLWTRRALGNRINTSIDLGLFKECLPYVCWQFRSGPWRNACIKFGVDPRSDPKYRIYQTLFFKIMAEKSPRNVNQPWKDARPEYARRAAGFYGDANTHLFDGKTVHCDGKFWQLCDISDPLLRNVIENGKVRSECDITQDGWFCNGTLAKITIIMRTKISAILLGRPGIPDIEFEETLRYPDEVADRKEAAPPAPDFRGSQEVQDELKRKYPGLVIPERSTFQKFTSANLGTAGRTKRLTGMDYLDDDDSEDDSEEHENDEDEDEDDEDDDDDSGGMVIMNQVSSQRRKASGGEGRGRPRGSRARGSQRGRGRGRRRQESILSDVEEDD